MAMMGELLKMGCAMLGAWGPATPTGGLVQLRALDWDTDGPFQAFPMVNPLFWGAYVLVHSRSAHGGGGFILFLITVLQISSHQRVQ